MFRHDGNSLQNCTGCTFYRVPQHGSFSAKKPRIRRDILWWFLCSETRQNRHSVHRKLQRVISLIVKLAIYIAVNSNLLLLLLSLLSSSSDKIHGTQKSRTRSTMTDPNVTQRDVTTNSSHPFRSDFPLCQHNTDKCVFSQYFKRCAFMQVTEQIHYATLLLKVWQQTKAYKQKQRIQNGRREIGSKEHRRNESDKSLKVFCYCYYYYYHHHHHHRISHFSALARKC